MRRFDFVLVLFALLGFASFVYLVYGLLWVVVIMGLLVLCFFDFGCRAFGLGCGCLFCGVDCALWCVWFWFGWLGLC